MLSFPFEGSTPEKRQGRVKKKREKRKKKAGPVVFGESRSGSSIKNKRRKEKELRYTQYSSSCSLYEARSLVLKPRCLYSCLPLLRSLSGLFYSFFPSSSPPLLSLSPLSPTVSIVPSHFIVRAAANTKKKKKELKTHLFSTTA